MVVVDVDFDEVDDVAVTDAVVEVADGSTEDEGQGYGGEGDAAAYSPEHDEDDDDGEERKEDECVADGRGRGAFGEHAEGGAGVFDVRDAEEARDDYAGSSQDTVHDEVLGEAVNENDEGRDG